MATGPIETHLHRSFNWENGAPGPREGQRGRSANCENGLFAQCVRLRSEINPRLVANSAKPSPNSTFAASKDYFCANFWIPIVTMGRRLVPTGEGNAYIFIT